MSEASGSPLGAPADLPDALDLENCAREPIHIPGAVQPHGALLALSWPELSVVQASANSGELLGVSPEDLLGRPLAGLVPEGELGDLRRFVAGQEAGVGEPYAFALTFPARSFDATAHCQGGLLILELEPSGAQAASHAFYHQTKNALSALEAAPDLVTLVGEAARQVRRLTGFDRVMIYRFAPDDSGEVIAEARREDLHSFFGHRFPESDIPRQARALYVRNMLRLTADVMARPVPLVPALNPVTHSPLDMSAATLRATSPVHVQYLKNMGVWSSLSVSIVQGGRLWGLIACHHEEAKFVPPAVRAACELLGRVLALQVAARLEADTFRFRQSLQQRSLRLVNAVSGSLDPLSALIQPELDLAALMRASGVALRFDGREALLGQTPAQGQVNELVAWLRSRGEAVFHSDTLGHEFGPAAHYAELASGVLGISLAGDWDEYLLWFRPEIPRTVTWGGDPHKPVEVARDGSRRLTPRQSFEDYVQTVRGSAEPWHPGEIEEVAALRAAFMESVGARLSALRELNTRLERSNAELRQFAFVTSHDLQEPLRIMTNFLELFTARYAGQLGEGADKLISFATGEASRLRALIRDLYAYTEIGAGAETFTAVPLAEVLRHTLAALQPALDKTGATVEIGELPVVWGNAHRLGQVLYQLIDNALKFAGPQPPQVRISAQRQGEFWRVSVSDRGIGIDPAYHDKIFTVFQRLNRLEEFPGNGIGLSIARKIVEQHGGRLWVESSPGMGAEFFFTLPATEVPHHA